MRIDIGEMTVTERTARIEALADKAKQGQISVAELGELGELLNSARYEYERISEIAGGVVEHFRDELGALFDKLGLDQL